MPVTQHISRPMPFEEAIALLEERGLLPTGWDTATLRERLTKEVRSSSLFVARGTSMGYLSELSAVGRAMLAGEMTRAQARLALEETLDALGYTAAGGFAVRGPQDASAKVPAAVSGSLRDLRSRRRLDLILDTQYRTHANAAYDRAAREPEALYSFPAYELVRVYLRRKPRTYPDYSGAAPGPLSDGEALGGWHDEAAGQGQLGWPRRWQQVGGRFYRDPESGLVRMIAAKGDRIWARLGSSAQFADALDRPHPPFAFWSGIGWAAVSREECERLGVPLHTARKADASPEETLPEPTWSTEGWDMDGLRAIYDELEAAGELDSRRGTLRRKGGRG